MTRPLAWMLLAALLPACSEPDLTVPSAGVVESYYPISAEYVVEMHGNVAVLVVEQEPDHLRRGGALWAKVGPYVYLFSEGTRDLFDDYPGLAGVRVVTRVPEGNEVARAALPRDALNAHTWKRALNLAGHVRTEGTRHVRTLEELIEWGEDHTEFRYDPGYVPR